MAIKEQVALSNSVDKIKKYFNKIASINTVE